VRVFFVNHRTIVLKFQMKRHIGASFLYEAVQIKNVANNHGKDKFSVFCRTNILIQTRKMSNQLEQVRSVNGQPTADREYMLQM
jgi:hypothetical protein